MSIKKVHTSELEIGMYVSRLDRPWRETPFLFQGFFLVNKQEIAKIKELGQYAYILLPDEEYTLTSERQSPGHLSATAINKLIGPVPKTRPRADRSFQKELPKAKNAHQMIVQMTTEIRRDLQTGKPLRIDEIQDTIGVMVDSVKRNPDAMMWLSRIKDYHSHTYRHSINVSTWLTLFGQQIGLNNHQLSQLASGGLILDIGNIRLPKKILDKKSRLTADEWELIKSHVKLGLDLLKASHHIDDVILAMVATHHERFDGSGYPNGLRSDQIPQFGAMAGIVDSYIATILKRPYAPLIPADKSIEMLYGLRGRYFEPELVKKFIQAVGLFPTGSLVELTSGEIAIVIAQNPNRRLRPRVILLLDPEKKPYGSYPIVDLIKETHTADGIPLNIVHGVKEGEYDLNLVEIDF